MVSARKHCETARHKRRSHINVFLTMRYGQGGGVGLMAPSRNSKTSSAKGHRKKISPPHLDWPSTWIVHLRIYPSFSTLLSMFIATGKSMVDLNIIDPENATILERVSYYSCVPLNRNAQYSGLCRFNQRNLSTSICRKRIEHTKLQSLKGRATTDGSPLKCCKWTAVFGQHLLVEGIGVPRCHSFHAGIGIMPNPSALPFTKIGKKHKDSYISSFEDPKLNPGITQTCTQVPKFW